MDCQYHVYRRVLLPVNIYFIGLESAAFPGQSADEIDRLLHVVSISFSIIATLRLTLLSQVVVGGGPTGVELR
jgi:NADH dehydrogenase FAD-containing subunit